MPNEVFQAGPAGESGAVEEPNGTESVRVSNGNEAVKELGQPRLARKKATISRRLPKGKVEVIETSWGAQEAHAGLDYVAIQKDGSEYPYKKELFHQNMEQVPGKPGEFRKKTLSKLLAVPEGLQVDCVTIDGGEQKPLKVTAPDFVCIGLDDEVYPMSRETFEQDFEWADRPSDEGAIQEKAAGWILS